MKTPPLTVSVKALIPASTKQKVSKILQQLSLTHSQAIRLFYTQIELTNGIPFKNLIPNQETQKVLHDSKKGKNVKSFATKKELFDDLGL